MTYYYGSYWADIRPVLSSAGTEILYWRYRIFESRTDKYLFQGMVPGFEDARTAAEAHIDRLNKELRPQSSAA